MTTRLGQIFTDDTLTCENCGRVILPHEIVDYNGPGRARHSPDCPLTIDSVMVPLGRIAAALERIAAALEARGTRDPEGPQ